MSSDLPSLAFSQCIAGRENTGYLLLNMEAIESGLNKIGLCCACHSSLMLEEKFKSGKELVTNISFSCSNPAWKKSVLV